jgi:hypothetical protein
MHIPSLTFWDWLLVGAVTCQSTVLAYLHHPLLKSFVLSLPIPFTLAMLAVNQPVDVTHVAAFGLLLLFYHVVRVAYRLWKWPIVAAIALAVGLHVGLASVLCGMLPRGGGAFWLTVALVVLAALGLNWGFPHQAEEGYRTPLPVWLKMPAIGLVTLGVVLAKGHLQGFVTAFPMVGLIAAYEGRFVLGTLCRQMPIFTLMVFPMILMIRIGQAYWGYAWAMVPGWLVFLGILIPVALGQWRRYRSEGGAMPE